MSASGEFKIRTLPRKDEGRRKEPSRTRKPNRWPAISKRNVAIGVTLVLVALCVALELVPKPTAHDQSSQVPFKDPMLKKLDLYAQDVKLKEDGLRQRLLLENSVTKAESDGRGADETAPELNRTYGVNLDSENTADRLYKELNDRPSLNVDALPEARINARLEKNKWVNQLDRQERVQFVRNFIKSAYDRGYEVELDQNLVVVGVKPILNRRVSLDQVIDRVSNQGF